MSPALLVHVAQTGMAFCVSGHSFEVMLFGFVVELPRAGSRCPGEFLAGNGVSRPKVLSTLSMKPS
jgi:hypothetical protein